MADMNHTQEKREAKQIYILIPPASRVHFDVLLWHFGPFESFDKTCVTLV